MTETSRYWHTKNDVPLPAREDSVPGTAQVTGIHGGALLLSGSFDSWLFDVVTQTRLAASIDALFAAYPDCTHAWVGNVMLINDRPLPRPASDPQTGNPGPMPPERPFP
jgi:hypothetical protein